MILRYFFIGIIAFTVLLSSWMLIAGEMATNYELDTSDQYFSKVTELQGVTNTTVQSVVSMQEGLQGGEVSDTSDTEGGLIRNALGVLMAIPTYLRVFKTSIFIIGDVINIPPFFITAAFACIMILVLFILISYIKGGEKV